MENENEFELNPEGFTAPVSSEPEQSAAAEPEQPASEPVPEQAGVSAAAAQAPQNPGYPQGWYSPYQQPAPGYYYNPYNPGQPYTAAQQPSGYYAYGRGPAERVSPKPEIPTAPAQPAKKKKSRVWIPLAIVGALIIGIGAGVGGYWIANRSSAPANDVQITEASMDAAALPSEQAGVLPPKAEPEKPAAPEEPAAPEKEAPAPEQPAAPAETADPEKEAATPVKDRDTTFKPDDSAGTENMTPAEIYSAYVDAVVGIAVEATGQNIWGQTVTQASSGTGFVLTENGYIATNYHVVEGANTITVMMNNGAQYSAEIVGYENTSCDVALLKIDAEGLSTVKLGNSDNLVVGESVCAIGNPLGELTFTLTVGYISALDRLVNTDGTPINMFQTDASINPGNSGGPLFDSCGNVIGITTAKYSGSTSTGATIEGIGFAIPINDVMRIVDDLVKYGYVTGRPYLGVSVADSMYYGSNLPAGAYVAETIDGYCAEKAGVQAGDVIVGLGDTVVGSRADLTAALGSYYAGDTTTLTVYRNGKYLTLDITLDEKPQDTETSEPAPSEPAQDDGGFGFPDFGFGG